MSIRRWIPILDEDEGLKFVSPDGTKGDFVMYADHEREVDALAAENVKLRRELDVERACHESASAANSKARAILQKIADDMTCDVHARMIASMAVYGVTGIARDTVQPSGERT